jgi:DedD protein
MAENDSQVDLKKRARRRLVGSAALALAAAIVLPMVMDHEPRTPPQDVQIRIPGQEGSNFTSRVITGKGPAPAQPVAGAVAEETAPPVADEPLRPKAEPELDSPVFKPGEELIPPPRKPDPSKADARPEAAQA